MSRYETSAFTLDFPAVRIFPNEQFNVWYVGNEDDVMAVLIGEGVRRRFALRHGFARFSAQMNDFLIPAFAKVSETVNDVALQWKLLGVGLTIPDPKAARYIDTPIP